MRKYSIIFSSFFIFISSAFSVEGDAQNVNEKYQFIKNIYNDSWALIIGINKYQNAPRLNYAEKDARDFKDLLSKNYGFKENNIIMMLSKEATKNNILAGFNDILERAKKEDRVVVYYAGHGETYELPSGGDMGFLVPVDGDPKNLYLTCIKMQEMYDLADMSFAKHILYLVDACYGGLTIHSRGLQKDMTPEYLHKLTKERGRQVITAGGKDEVVIENPKWGNSAFTKNLLNGLGEDLLADENNDGIITADELGGFIKNRVIVDVNGAHTPQQGRIGSDMGEFVFISETYKEELALVDPDQLSDVQKELESQKEEMKTQQEQMALQQEQMAQLTELLLKQTQEVEQTKQENITSPERYPNHSPANKPIKPPKSINMKTATTLAWMFPGMGHYYSGRTGKGMFFTALEVGSIAATYGSSSEYSAKQDAYATAQAELVAAQLAYSVFTEKVVAGETWTNVEKELIIERQADAVIARNKAVVEQTKTFNIMRNYGIITAVVWVWNIWDVKKSAKKYSSNHSTSVGINRQGQVTFTIKF